MRFRTIMLIVAGVATAAFFVGNRQVFSAPASFHFLFGTVDIPIGVVMLALVGVVVLAFAIYAAFWQSTLLLDYRRQAKELETQRSLADDAEASRFTELSVLLRAELTKLDKRLESSLDALRSELRDTEHSIAATLGEMDDRMRRSALRLPE
jgi:uncharacterized integral membrane protein